MSTQKVAAITGASRGIGAGLVTACRKLGYAVVANARSITPSDDPMVLTVPATSPLRASAHAWARGQHLDQPGRPRQ